MCGEQPSSLQTEPTRCPVRWLKVARKWGTGGGSEAAQMSPERWQRLSDQGLALCSRPPGSSLQGF